MLSNLLTYRSVRIARAILFSIAAFGMVFSPFSPLVSVAHAAPGIPEILNYQGRLMDQNGNLLGGSGTDFCFQFSIYDDPTPGSGTRLWPTAAPSTMTIEVTNGVFNAGIGDTGAGGDTLDYNFQDNDTIYLNVDVATRVGATCAPGDGAEVFETLSPRQRILATGYAINAGTVGGFTPAQEATDDEIPVLSSGALILASSSPYINATSSNALTLQGGGAVTGDIQFFSSANRITAAGNATFAGELTALGVNLTNATFTNATSTSLFSSIANFTSAVIGTLTATDAILTRSTTTNATTTNLFSSLAEITSAVIGNLTATDATITRATTSAATTTDFAITGALSDGASAGSNGFILQTDGNSIQWVSTTTLGFNDDTSPFGQGWEIDPFGSLQPTTTRGILLVASSTIIDLTSERSTTTSATSTNFAITSVTDALLATDANGTVIATTTLGESLIPDVFIRNDGDDSTTGVITAGGLVSNGTLSVAATSSAATTTATAVDVGGDVITDFTGTGLQLSSGALTLDATGDWTGTFDGQEGSYYLDATNLTDFGTPFYTFFSATTTDALTEGSSNFYYTTNRFASDLAGTTTDALSEGSTNFYYTENRFSVSLGATTTVGSITSLPNLATVGTITSGTWNGNIITDTYTADNLTLSGGNIGSNNIDGTLTTLGALTIGDGGDQIDINSDTWDIINGVLSGADAILTHSTTTNATTTSLAITGISDAVLKTTAAGGVVAAVAGVDYATPGTSPFGQAWSLSGGVLSPTTTAGVLVSASSTITDLTTVRATTTDLTVSGTLTLSNALSETSGGTGQGTYATGDILYASGANTLTRLAAGVNGQVLKLTAGVPAWGTDASGGGGSGVWSTTTDELAIFTTDSSDVVIVGASVTTTPSSILEVTGSSFFSDNVGIATTSPFARISVGGDAYFGGNVTATGTLSVEGDTTLVGAEITRSTTTNATSTTLFSSIANFTSAVISTLTATDAIFTRSTTTNATTTNLAVTGGLSDGTNFGTNGYVLQTTGTGVQWVATSTLGLGGGNGTVESGTQGQLPFYASNGTTLTATSSLFLDTNGNFGVGTTSPVSAFAVSGTTTIAGNLLPAVDDVFDLGSSTQRWRDLYLGPSSLHIGIDGNEGVIGYSTTSEQITINPSGDGTPEFVFTDDGRLGIGTTSPSNTFSVEGTFDVTGTTTLGTTTITNITITGDNNSSEFNFATATNATTTNFAILGSLNDNSGTPGTNGYVLQTTGTGVQWVATSSLGISGGGTSNFGQAFELDGSGNLAPTTTVGVVVTASSTITDLTAVNATTTNATSTTFQTNTLGVGSDYITDFTGTGITLVGGALTVDSNTFFSLADWFATTTDALAEGSTNFYYTTNRFAADLAGTTTDALTEGATNRYYATALFATDLAATTTDALSEGSTNLYWTQTRFDTALSATTTLPNLAVLQGLTDVIATRATTTNATTTNLAVTGGLSDGTSFGTNGFVLQTTGTGVQWVATSSLGISGGGSSNFGQAFELDGSGALAPTTTTGVLITASSTITDLTTVRSTTTSATTTNLAVTGTISVPANSIDISDDTNLVAGSDISLSGDTLNVDDSFLRNDADDTTTGTLTAAGFTTTGTSTAATTTATAVDVNSDVITDFTGTGLSLSGGALTLDATGDWTGTFDGQEGSYYLNANNLTDFGTPFYTFFSATTTDALTEGSSNFYYTTNRFASDLAGTTTDALSEGSNNLYWTQARFDAALSATTTLPNLTTLLGLTDTISTRSTTTNATTTNFAITGALNDGSGAGTNGFVLQTTGTGIQWVATSTLGLGGGGSVPFGQGWELDGSGNLAPTTTVGVIVTASSTITDLTAVNATTTNATSTSLFSSIANFTSAVISTLTATDAIFTRSTTTEFAITGTTDSLLATDGNGQVGATTTIGSNLLSADVVTDDEIDTSSELAGIVTDETGDGALVFANDSALTGDTTIQGVDITRSTTTNATTTNLAITGGLSDGTNFGTNGFVLQTTGTGVQWVATSSLGIEGGSGSPFGQAWELDGSGALAPTTTVGVVLAASSTITNLTSLFATTTNLLATTATTTNLILSGTTNALLSTDGSGNVVSTTTIGSNYLTADVILQSEIDTSSELAGIVGDETGTGALVFAVDSALTGDTTIAGVDITNSTTTNATTTNLAVTGALNDGTSSGVNGYVLQTTGTGVQWVATSSLGLGGGGSAPFGQAFELDGSGALAPTTTTGVLITSSSTITDLTAVNATTTNLNLTGSANALLSTDASGNVVSTSTIGADVIADAFLRNDADDTTTGTITAAGFTTTGTSTAATTTATAVDVNSDVITDFTGTGIQLVSGALTVDSGTFFSLADWYATTTDALAEGTTNFYYTTNRFAADLAGTTTDALAQGSTNFYYATSLFAADLAGTTTDALSEGSNNLYWTQARFDTALAGTTTLNNLAILQGLTDAIITRSTTTNATTTNLAVSGDLTSTGDTSLTNLTATQSTTTNATTTNLAITGGLSDGTNFGTNGFVLQTTGTGVQWVATSSLGIEGGSGSPFGQAWELDGSGALAPTTTVGVVLAASSTITNLTSLFATTTNLLATTATTTNLILSGTTNALLSTDASGNVVATSSIGASLLPDLFLRNDQDDTTTGTLTAAGFTTTGTSTAATTTATAVDVNSDVITDFTGTGLSLSGGALTLDATGDWTGTFDGQEGSYYLNANNLTDFGTPFYTFFSATTTDALTEGSSNFYYTTNRFASDLAGTTTDALSEGSNNLYWTQARFDAALSATTTLPNLTTLLGLTDTISTRSTTTNATTTNFAITGALNDGSGAGTNGFVLQTTGTGIQWVATSTLGLGGGGSVPFGQGWELDGSGNLAPTTTVGVIVTASSTITDLTAVNATTTNATSTSLFSSIANFTSAVISTLTATDAIFTRSTTTEFAITGTTDSLLATDGNGQVGATTTIGSNLLSADVVTDDEIDTSSELAGIVTDETGDGALVFANDSALTGDTTIQGVDITRSTTTNATTTNLAVTGSISVPANSIDISDDTNLVAGSDISLSGDTLNVDDSFLRNDADDTTTGTLTAAGFTTTGTSSAATTTATAVDVNSDVITDFTGTGLLLTGGALTVDNTTFFTLADWYATTTDALTEGSTNFYYTTNRFASDLAGTTTDALTQGATNRYYSTLLFATDLAGTTTDALSEGSNNLYWTQTRFDTALAGTTTLNNLAILQGLTDTITTRSTTTNATTTNLAITGGLSDGTNFGTNGFVLQTTGTGVQWVATSSLGISGGSSFDYLFPGNATTTLLTFNGGIESYASSTVTDLTAIFATTTNLLATTATTTNLILSGTTNALLSTDGSGNVVSTTTIGSNYLTADVILQSEIDTSSELAGIVGDETGTGALVFAVDSALTGDTTIAGVDITNSTTTNATTTNLAVTGSISVPANSIDISSDTNLVAGSDISLAGDTLNVDDSFLRNDADDTTTGTITAAGFTTTGTSTAATTTATAVDVNSDVITDFTGTGLLLTGGALTVDSGTFFTLSDWYATTTDGLTEGSTNFYYTTNRFAADLAGTTTDALAQGSTNFYYATTLFATDLAATTTDALSEGSTNLYFTNQRVDDRINASTTILSTNNESGLESFLSDVTNVFTNNDTIGDANIANSLTLTGGSIDGTPIGNTTPSTGVFTSATATNATTTNLAITGTTNAVLATDGNGVVISTTTIGASLLDLSVILASEIDTSSELAGIVTDETGDGALVFANDSALTGDTTIQGVDITRSTTTNATTTNLAITGGLSDGTNFGTNGFVLQTTGTGVQWVATSSLGISGGSSFDYLFPGNATSTELAFNGGLTSYASTTITDLTSVFATTTNLVATTATTTNLVLSGLTNALLSTDASGNVVSTTTIGSNYLTADVILSSEIDTSAELAGIVTDETGIGALVFAVDSALTGDTTIAGVDITNSTTTNATSTSLFSSIANFTSAVISTLTATDAIFTRSTTTEFAITGTTDSLLATDGNGQVGATTTIGSNLLSADVVTDDEIDTSSELAGIVTDETGDGALVFANDSALTGDTTIQGVDITRSTTTNATTTNLAVTGSISVPANSIDISDDTNLVAGSDISLSGDTLNVDDSFLRNDADDTTTGTLTAAGFTTTGTSSAATTTATAVDVNSDVITDFTGTGLLLTGGALTVDNTTFFTLADWYATTTDALTEGSTNFYYTTNRFASDLAGTTTDALTQGATNRYYSTLLFATDLAGTTTDALSEGSNNLYWTQTRFDTALAGTTTLNNLAILQGLTDTITTRSTTTNATTTNFAITGTTNAVLATDGNGVVISTTTIGASLLDLSVILASEIDTSSELAGIVTDETGDGALVFANDSALTGDTTIQGVDITRSTTTNATTTNLAITGGLSDGTNFGTNGQLLQTDGSGISWVSTSTLGLGTGTVGAGTQGQLPFYNAAGDVLTATSSIFLTQAGDFGIGTTSPAAQLAAAGLLYIGGTGTSTIQDNLEVLGGLQVGNSSLYLDTNSIENLSGDLIIQPGTGNVAVGTSTPYSTLTVWADPTGTAFEVVTNASSTALAVAATGFGTTTVSGLNINGSATTTSNVGLNITGGCFAVNGTCLSGGGGSSPLTTKGDIYTFDTSDARLPVGTDGQLLVASSTTATGLAWEDLNGHVDAATFYDNTGGTAISSGSFVTMNLDATSTTTDTTAFTLNAADDVTINRTGFYMVSYEVTAVLTAGTRSGMEAILQENTGGGFTNIDGSRSFLYGRLTTEVTGTAAATIVEHFDAGDLIRIQAAGNTRTLSGTVDGTRLTIISLDGVGRDGEDGADGADATAAGSNGEIQFNDYSAFGTDAGLTFSTTTGVLESTNASTTNLNIGGELRDNSASAGLDGYVLQSTGSGLTWVATSSLGISNFTDSDDVPEGSTNLYYTDTRVDNRINATTTIGTLTSAPALGTVSTALNGFVRATAGVLSASSLINLASEVTGILAISNGGTGTSTAPQLGNLLVGNSSGEYDYVATSSLNIALSDTDGELSETRGGTGQNSYTLGDILYASAGNTLSKLPIGSPGQVLKVTGGVPAWGIDQTTGGGGGGDGVWATTTDDFAIYPVDTSDVVIVGTNATATENSIFEVSGRSYFSNNVGIGTTSPGTLLSVGTAANFANGGSSIYSDLTLGSTLSVQGSAQLNGVVAATLEANTIEAGTVSTSTIQGDTFGTSTIQGFLNVLGTNSTSTFSGGLAAAGLSVTGSATSTFANGLDIASGCLAINGTCLEAGVSSVTAGNTGVTITPNTGGVVVSLNLNNANVWTGLQEFSGGASTTALSATQYIAVGGTATTTIRGEANATSTFAGGIEGSYINLTGTSATNTFSNGISISNGCFAIDGTCLSTDVTLGVTPNVFEADGTYNTPADTEYAQVIVTGGGGGAGGVNGTDTTNEQGSAGGGAGGTSIETFTAGELGASQSVTVGAGGTGGAAGSNGNAGNISLFGNLVGAEAGGGGTGSSGAGTCNTNHTPGAGGVATTTGDVNLAGGAGGAGVCDAEEAGGGVGGSSYWGGGGIGAHVNGAGTEVGGAGAAYGSGGGGAAAVDTVGGAAGGDGADGVVVVFSYTASGGDFAEWYPTQPGVEPGDVVAVSSDTLEYESFGLGLQKTSIMEKAQPGSTVIGVVSTLPNQVIGGEILGQAEEAKPIALAGRVPVKISEENGKIFAGDHLTLSSVPGVAMKATKAGVTLGRALEDADCSVDDENGEIAEDVIGETCQVLTLVSTSYTSGILLKEAMEQDGLVLEEVPGDIDISRVALSQLIREKKDIVDTSALSEINTDRLTAGLEVVTPRVVTETLVASVIEPVENDVTMKLTEEGLFVIERVGEDGMSLTFGDSASSTEESEFAVSIDALGNAFFAGTLSAANLEVGSSEEPAGITMYDQTTGDPFCAQIVEGELITTEGICGSVNPLDLPAAPVEGAPEITINGNNPAQIEVNASYSDLGALVTDDVDLNLGISTFVDGVEVDDVSLDTSTSTVYEITYRATDTDGNTGEATRLVIVGDALEEALEPEEEEPEEEPSEGEAEETTEESNTGESEEEGVDEGVEEEIIEDDQNTEAQATSTEEVIDEGTVEEVAEEEVIEEGSGEEVPEQLIASEEEEAEESPAEEVAEEEVVVEPSEEEVAEAPEEEPEV